MPFWVHRIFLYEATHWKDISKVANVQNMDFLQKPKIHRTQARIFHLFFLLHLGRYPVFSYSYVQHRSMSSRVYYSYLRRQTRAPMYRSHIPSLPEIHAEHIREDFHLEYRRLILGGKKKVHPVMVALALSWVFSHLEGFRWRMLHRGIELAQNTL